MIFLKQSTAATLRVGPFMDAGNGVTPETGVTLGAADQAEILKASGATVDISGATWAAITGAGGWYDLSLTTSHTDTLGMITVIVQDESVCLPVFVRAMVIPAQVFESLIAGSEYLASTPWPQRFSISGSTLTHYKTDAATTQGQRTLSSAAVNPITGNTAL
jgi:hypothetical protein